LNGHQHLVDLGAVQEILQSTVGSAESSAVHPGSRATGVVCAERSRVDEDAETACAQSKETTKLGEIVFAVSQDRIREHWTVGAQCGVAGMSGMVPPGPMTFVDFRLAPALFSMLEIPQAR